MMKVQSRKFKVQSNSKVQSVLWPYFALCTLSFALVVGCAMKSAPALPEVPKYPDFVYPRTVPASAEQAAAVDRGWRFLQNDDLKNAEREFDAVLKTNPGFPPARTGEGYVDAARKDNMAAVQAFDTALNESPAYVPALV